MKTGTPKQNIESLIFQSAQFHYEPAKPIFKSLTVNVPLNCLMFVTGPNGSGHSTFLKLLAVLMQPCQGSYLINGQDTTQMSFEEFLPLRRQIGYTFDFGGLFANRTLLDNLALPLLYHDLKTRDEAHAEIRALAKDFKFENQLDQRPAAVSGGLRKLACVLRSFLMGPEMMVLDDPFTGIGTESSKKLVELIIERRASNELRHVFLTSREEIWPARLGCRTLWIEKEQLELREGAAA